MQRCDFCAEEPVVTNPAPSMQQNWRHLCERHLNQSQARATAAGREPTTHVPYEEEEVKSDPRVVWNETKKAMKAERAAQPKRVRVDGGTVLSRTVCINSLKAAGYTGPTSYSVSRLNEILNQWLAR